MSCVIVASSTRVLVHSLLRVLVMFSFHVVIGSSSCAIVAWSIGMGIVRRCRPLVVPCAGRVIFLYFVVESSLCWVVVVGSYSSHVVVVSSSHGLFVASLSHPVASSWVSAREEGGMGYTYHVLESRWVHVGVRVVVGMVGTRRPLWAFVARRRPWALVAHCCSWVVALVVGVRYRRWWIAAAVT